MWIIDRITKVFKKDKVVESPKRLYNFFGSAITGARNQNVASLQSLSVWLNYDGSIRITPYTYFALIKKNSIIASWIRFLSQRIWGNGYDLVDSKGNVIDWQDKIKERINYFFSNTSIENYIYRSLVNYITSWQKISTATEINKNWRATPKAKINVLDPRYITINTDWKTTDVVSYIYWNNLEQMTLSPEIVVDDIQYPDFDRTNYWQSQLEPVVMDALIDQASNDRSFGFHRNNATPSTVYSLDPESITSIEEAKELESQIIEKHWGSTNTWKPLVSSAIKWVHTIQVPKIDASTEKEMTIKILSMVIWVDPRVLWFMKTTGGSYAEIDAISRNMTNAKIIERERKIEDGMNKEYRKFIWDSPYKIKLKSILFENKEKEKEIAMMEVEKGIMTVEEYKSLFNMV